MNDSVKPVLPLLPNLSHPVVSRERFAELTGLPIGVIIGFANRGYLPTISIGKYSLINVELLRKRCLDLEFK
jgi:hypothetical protein